MKRIFILIASVISLIAMSLPASAYEPTVREDRIWAYQGTYYDRVHTLQSYSDSKTFFKGTAEKKGIVYNVLTNDKQDTVALMRQCGDRVYRYIDETMQTSRNIRYPHNEILLYDFGLEEGEWLNTMVFEQGQSLLWTSNRYRVEYKDSVYVEGKPCRRMKCMKYADGGALEHAFTVVEGIGTSAGRIYMPVPSNPYDDLSGMPVTEHLQYVLNADSRTIFTENDFFQEGYAEITEIPEERNLTDDSRKYDLMGREIKAPAPGTVYIQGGRKLIAR